MAFSFIQITDHHLRETEDTLTFGFSPGYAFRAVLRHIAQHAASRCDFLVSTGDLVHTGTAAEYANFRRVLGMDINPSPIPSLKKGGGPDALAPSSPPPPHIRGEKRGVGKEGGGLGRSGTVTPQPVTAEGLDGYPMLFLPGNHDPRPEFSRHIYPHLSPTRLLNAGYEYQGVRFVCLDWGPGVKAMAHRETLRFLAESLADGTPCVLLMHHHVTPVGAKWLDTFIMEGVGQFWETVRGKRVLGILCGHCHITYERVVEGVPVLGLRATTFQFLPQDPPVFCLQPPHYRVVTVDGDRLTSEIVEVAL